MGGSSKNSTSTQSVQIPQDVLNRYNAVNARAETTAQTPFQTYSNDPSAFVAPMNSTQQSGVANTNTAAGQAQPYFDAATGQLVASQNGAQPYIGASGSQLLSGLGSGQSYLNAANQGLGAAQSSGQSYIGASGNQLSNAQSSAQPYIAAAGQGLGAANENIQAGLGVGSGLAGASLQSLQAANENANPLNASANQFYTGAYQGAQPYNQAAGSLIGQGLGAANPLNSQAQSGLSSSYAGAQPYNQIAAGLAGASAQAVNPNQIGGAEINQFMSPYLQQVLGSTSALLNQNNQQQMSGQTGSAIQQGAFGGDRAGIAAANLAQQQQLANASIYSGILNQGYGQALSAAQQQQGVGLGAAQANRAALSGAAGQLAGIGQQQYGQGTGTAQAQAALGQQLYGQGLGAGQAVQGLGQQVYGQGTGTGQAQAQLGQQVFGQGATTAAQQAQLGQQQYSQALGAASQQAQLAQQQAALGQQQYGMGANTAQQLAALGQQQYGMGANTAQQQAALGQAQYGMGAQTAQQLAALGQQQYGMGANTSQQLAGLGAGAQAAGLQGAQAQLAAGQVGQQTQQAGLTALYNQFLQQQSYPFQTAQFLANIAEGTGSLSGSTTTTTQPGGFFSDKRLKEDMEPIGETYDGQKIVKFRYKNGDPRKQIGLIAQDVEKKHPEAVGLAAGYRTVDYDKATADAAKRGKFADGGTPVLPGLSGADMAALLAAQQQMYAPFSQNGIYGSPAGSAPRGGSSYVPQANLPVSHLTVAGDLPTQKSGVEQASEIAAMASKAAPYAKAAKDKWDKRQANDNEEEARDHKARGGLAVAKRYASGGSPYSGGVGLDIPDEKPDHKLMTAGDLPGGKKSDFETAMDIAKVAAMFAVKRGGRIEKAGGGGFEPDIITGDAGDITLRKQPEQVSLPDRIGRSLSYLSDHDAVKHALRSLTHPDIQKDAPPGWREALKSPGLAPQVTEEPIRLTSAPAGAARNTVAPRRPVSAPRPTGIAPAAVAPPSAPPTPISADSPVSIQASPGIAAANVNIEPTNTSPPNIRAPKEPKEPNVIERAAESVGKPVGDYLKGLKKGDAQNWLPLISAIAAAGTARTVHPGVALAAGLGAGAETYMGTKERLAEVAKTRAEQGRTEATSTILNAPTPVDGYTWVPGPGPNGEAIPGKDGKTVWHREMNVNATNYGGNKTPGATPAVSTEPVFMAPSSETVQHLREQYGVDPSQPGVANHERAIAMNPEVAAIDQAARESVQKRIGDLQVTENAKRQLLQLSEAVNGLSTGVAGQGHGSEWRARAVNMAVTAANLLGIPVDPALTTDLDEQQIIAKIRQMMGPTLANQNDQKSASVAHAITGVLPGGDLQPAAANEILSSMLVQTQQPRDLSNYVNNYAKFGLMAGVEPAFAKDTGSTYDHEQRAIPKFMASPAFNASMNALRSPKPEVRARAAEILDQQYGPNFHRYFAGER